MPQTILAGITAGALWLIAVIHLLPLVGVFGPKRLTALYAIPVDEANLEILMRHRAVLFGLLGSLLVYAGFVPSVQPLAFVGALVSIVSFLVLAHSVGGVNDSLRRVVVVDVIAFIAWVIAVGSYALERGLV